MRSSIDQSFNNTKGRTVTRRIDAEWKTNLRFILVLFVGACLSQVAQAQHAHKHDEVNMPGLRGENASDKESAEIAVLFRNFRSITRNVDNLPNGIRTITSSSDPAVMGVLVSHVVGMIDRVEQQNDPKIRIQSPTLDVFFLQGDEIDSNIEVTEEVPITQQ